MEHRPVPLHQPAHPASAAQFAGHSPGPHDSPGGLPGSLRYEWPPTVNSNQKNVSLGAAGLHACYSPQMHEIDDLSNETETSAPAGRQANSRYLAEQKKGGS